MTTAYDPDNVFAKILRGEIPSTHVYADDDCIAIRDIAPVAPTHILVIPRAQCTGPGALAPGDAGWVGRMVVAATRIAAELGLERDGYRLVLNQGRDAGQEVPHLHLHLLGGGPLGPFA